MKVKITSRGLTVDGKLWPCYLSYDNGQRHRQTGKRDERGFPVIEFWQAEPASVGVSVKRYRSLPAGVAEALGVAVKNDTDTMTDYFDNDRFRVPAGHPRFREALEAYLKKERSWLAHKEKRATLNRPAVGINADRAKLDAIEREHGLVEAAPPKHRKLRGAQDSLTAHTTEPVVFRDENKDIPLPKTDVIFEFPSRGAVDLLLACTPPTTPPEVVAELQVEWLRWLGVEP